mmetsp:Transcript_24473/g.79897  ORF Transcript_24473/g.79897 Transcript_24473/m.79897 type:complete len:234 (+) Transcript_24473:42-743(+)
MEYPTCFECLHIVQLPEWCSCHYPVWRRSERRGSGANAGAHLLAGVSAISSSASSSSFQSISWSMNEMSILFPRLSPGVGLLSSSLLVVSEERASLSRTDATVRRRSSASMELAEERAARSMRDTGLPSVSSASMATADGAYSIALTVLERPRWIGAASSAPREKTEGAVLSEFGAWAAASCSASSSSMNEMAFLFRARVGLSSSLPSNSAEGDLTSMDGIVRRSSLALVVDA